MQLCLTFRSEKVPWNSQKREENQDFSLAKTHAYGKYPLTQNRKN